MTQLRESGGKKRKEKETVTTEIQTQDASDLHHRIRSQNASEIQNFLEVLINTRIICICCYAGCRIARTQTSTVIAEG